MIKCDSARIETATPSEKGEYSAFVDLSHALMGFAAVLRFSPSMCGHFVLATRNGDSNGIFLIGVPSERWLGDLKDEGFTVIQTIAPPPKSEGVNQQ